MNTLEAIKTRRSIRKYEDRMPSAEAIAAIAEAGSYAASGRNKQSAVILIVKNREIRDRLSRMNAEIREVSVDPFYNAPVVIVVLADRERPTHVYDGSLVMGNMMLAAKELGLGSCWIHRAKEMFDSPEGKEILKAAGIEGDYEGIGNLVVGYPAEDAKLRPRKSNYIFELD